VTAHDECCTQDCNQGRDCPRRLVRPVGPSALRRLLGWLLRERRGGFDRRARAVAVPAITGMEQQCR
jgi:hypothetical protein